jgi:hypothetical protein
VCLVLLAPSLVRAENLRIAPSAVVVSVTLTGTPQTGTCPFTMAVSWTATNASVCTKSGGWSGNVNASGSSSETVDSPQKTYTLTCSSNTDSRTVTWANPTQNTDGTTATLKGNKLYHGNSQASVDPGSGLSNAPIVLEPARTSYLLSGLPAGPRYVSVVATSSVSPFLDSSISNIAQTTISLPSGAATLQAGCTTPPTPKPPTAVTIAATVWDVLNTRDGPLVGQDVGTIGIGEKCLGKAPWIIQQPANAESDGYWTTPTEYWQVPKGKASLYRTPRSKELVANCQRET